MSNTQTPRIERGATYIVVPKARFVYPAEGPGNYRTVLGSVKDKKLALATGEQTASLLNEFYTSESNEFTKSPEADNVKGIMKDNYFWIPNRVLWTPRSADNAGVYIQHDPNAVGLSERLDIGQLEDALSGGKTIKCVRFSKDGRTAFASLNTVTLEAQSRERLANNGFVIASYGVEGAEQLAKVSAKFALKPYVWGVDNNTNQPIQRLSALNRDWGGGRLSVSGGNDDSSALGYAFGVSGSD